MLDEGSDASAGDGDVLDARADDVTLRHGDHVGYPVPRVDHHACQGSLANLGNIGRGSRYSNSGENISKHLSSCPGGGKTKYSLDSNVEPGHVEALKHNLRRILPVHKVDNTRPETRGKVTCFQGCSVEAR